MVGIVNASVGSGRGADERDAAVGGGRHIEYL